MVELKGIRKVARSDESEKLVGPSSRCSSSVENSNVIVVHAQPVVNRTASCEQNVEGANTVADGDVDGDDKLYARVAKHAVHFLV
mmetsp:Transcript_12735/g.32275  ORF Transcript_12735/g.32275 Transcript_12735/m.32275 type:complete len:85 (-) Transcript_12735:390-644(-)